MFKQGLHCFYQRKVFRYMEEQFPRLSEEIERFRRSTELHCQSEPVTSPLDTVHEIGILQATQIIHDYSPIGCYWCVNGGGKFVAIDNRTGQAWTEEFDNKEIMMDWFNDKFEMSNIEEYTSLKLSTMGFIK